MKNLSNFSNQQLLEEDKAENNNNNNNEIKNLKIHNMRNSI